MSTLDHPILIRPRQQWADYFDANNVKYAFFSAANAKALQEARAAEEQAILEAEEQAERGSDDGEGSSSGEEYEESDEYKDEEEDLRPEDIPKAARAKKELEAEDHDPRTQVLSVLELESLFVNSAPDLRRMCCSIC